MTRVHEGWGQGPDDHYEALADRFRCIFSDIRAGAVDREVNRKLPHDEIRLLVDAGFTAVRVPEEFGGAGISLPALFSLLVELGEADSNVAQSLRAHFSFVEIVLNSDRKQWRETWLRRIAVGAVVGAGRSEAGNDVRQGIRSTRLTQTNGVWRLSGTKFYSTGLLYSDWADVSASGDDGEIYAVTVRTDAEGVVREDDWSGFGQRLTASGTTHYHDVVVEEAEIRPDKQRFPYSQAFLQLAHLATLAGIGRAAASEAALAVRERKRSFSSGNSALVRDDPQILQVVGRLRGAAYAAGALVLQNAFALERAWVASRSRDEERIREAREMTDLEVAQAQSIVIELILQSTSLLFDTLGASSTLAANALDRFWRNARTLATHNPRFYKDRIAGDFAVNGNPPPDQWKVGVA